MITLRDKNGSFIREFRISDFQINDELKEEIYLEKNSPNIKGTLFCNCEGIEKQVNIGKKSSSTIYLFNAKGNGPKHSKYCPLSTIYQPSSVHEHGWTTDGEGVLKVNPSPSMFSRESEGEINEEGVTKHKHYEVKQVTPIKSESRVTLLGLLSRLNMMTWDDYCLNKKHKVTSKTPDTLYEFMKQNYGTKRKIKLKNKTNLQETSYNFSEILKMKKTKKGLLFVFNPLGKVVPATYPDGNKIKGLSTIEFYHYNTNGEPKKNYLNCPTYLIENAYKKHNQPIVEQDEKGIFHALVGGFVKLFNGRPEFASIEFLPIIEQGLWTESSFENKVYSNLCKQQISFSKGYLGLEFYNNFVPDIVFFNKLDSEKPYIGEIFGRENDEKYTKRKMEKLELAKNSNEFDFWSVEAHNGNLDSLPPFYPSDYPS